MFDESKSYWYCFYNKFIHTRINNDKFSCKRWDKNKGKPRLFILHLFSIRNYIIIIYFDRKPHLLYRPLEDTGLNWNVLFLFPFYRPVWLLTSLRLLGQHRNISTKFSTIRESEQCTFNLNQLTYINTGDKKCAQKCCAFFVEKVVSCLEYMCAVQCTGICI